MTNASEPRPSTVRLQRMVRAYRESAALMAGVELGLFLLDHVHEQIN